MKKMFNYTIPATALDNIFSVSMFVLIAGVGYLAVSVSHESVETKTPGFIAATQSVSSDYVCGNNIVEGAEECDGHDKVRGVYCNEDCTSMLVR